MLKLLYTLLSIVLCISCSQNIQTQEKPNNTQKIVEQNTLKETVQTLVFKDIPYTDSTNFDNYEFQETDLNKLPTTYSFDLNKENISDIRLRYKLNLSNKFESLVISYLLGEHELYTTLINFDQNKKAIDMLDIAYDEIAESAFRSISVISENSITKYQYNFMNEDETLEAENYEISEQGFFTKN